MYYIQEHFLFSQNMLDQSFFLQKLGKIKQKKSAQNQNKK